MTLGLLAGQMATFADRMDKKIDDLADSVKAGFEEVDEKFVAVNGRLGRLEGGMEEVKLRLTEVAHSFETKELERRVTRLERNAGLAA